MTASPIDPADGLPRTVRAARATVPGRPAVPGAPHRAAGGKTSPQRRERASAAGIPSPETGTADPGFTPAVPVRGRAQDPAVGAVNAHAAPSAGTTGRTFTITLPAGLELLNANDRDGHWARRKRITRALRETAGWKARIQHIPALQRAYILGVYEPPDRRRRDPANLYPSFKACVDGLVDAGVLPDDDAAHVDGPDMRLGDVCPLGRLVLHLTEAPPLVAADGAA